MMKDLEKAFDNMINPKPKELDISELMVQLSEKTRIEI